MAKTNIIFNNKNFEIDNASLSSATTSLKSHLSTVMNGTGATITLDGTAYGVDATKLSTATNGFISHLGTISGSGSKVVVNGVEYGVDSAKVAGAISELETVLGGLNSGNGGSDVGGSDTLYWDGNTEGLDAVGGRYYKVSDVTPSITDLENGSMIFFEHIDEPMPLEFAEVFEGILMASYSVIIVTEKGVGIDLGGVSFSETGIYFVNDGTSHVKSFTINGYTGFPSTPPEPTDETLEGDGQEFHKFAPTALSFRSTAPLNELQEVQINGVTVDPSNYTLEEGSTIVTFPIDYLKTLDVDNYEITVVSDSKSAKGGFTVVEPELNEHGFYYNQPYTAYVAMFGENESFFIRDDGTMDIVGTPSGDVSPATYSVNGNNITVVSPIAGTLTGTISSDGTEIFCNELQTAFKLGNDSIVSDEDYIYIYKEDLGGYEVKAIDKTKSEYGVIKTGINGYDTVKLAGGTFVNNVNIVTAPKIPNGVVTIDNQAFQGCTSLESIIIPSSVTSMGGNAFGWCTSLKNIVFEGTAEQWNAITKDMNWNILVPATEVTCSDGTVALEYDNDATN